MAESLSREERRAFLLKAGSMLGITVCSASLAALVSACEKDEVKTPTGTNNAITVDVSKETALQTVGGGVRKTFPALNSANPVIIVRTTQTSFLVVTAVCTHAGCTLTPPNQNSTNITCYYADNNCGHSAEYDPTTGLQVVGPAGADPSGGLKTFTNSYNANTQILTIG